MKRISIVLFLLFFSVTVLAASIHLQQKPLDPAVFVALISSQPLTIQRHCALKGYIDYQNAIGATYFTGSHNNKINPVKAYAWSLVAYHQLLKTKFQKLIAAQYKATQFVSKTMTPAQKKKSDLLARMIIKHYSRSWANATAALKMKNFPVPCVIR